MTIPRGNSLGTNATMYLGLAINENNVVTHLGSDEDVRPHLDGRRGAGCVFQWASQDVPVLAQILSRSSGKLWTRPRLNQMHAGWGTHRMRLKAGVTLH